MDAGACVRFFTGLHQPSDAPHFDAAFISVTRLTGRKGRRAPMRCGDWIMDSGAFTTIKRHGGYPEGVEPYADAIRRWATNGSGRLLAAVSQDFMCEPEMLKRTGLSIPEHQRLTIERYDALMACKPPVYILPVLQGYAPADYVRHLEQYGDRLAHGAWVGVGSVCKRNADPGAVIAVLLAIKSARPDLLLHGFGLKTTAIGHPVVRSLLHTADSMAWSLNARLNQRNANDWRNAKAWAARITDSPYQTQLW
jgi:hypothetical protein